MHAFVTLLWVLLTVEHSVVVRNLLDEGDLLTAQREPNVASIDDVLEVGSSDTYHDLTLNNANQKEGRLRMRELLLHPDTFQLSLQCEVVRVVADELTIEVSVDAVIVFPNGEGFTVPSIPADNVVARG